MKKVFVFLAAALLQAGAWAATYHYTSNPYDPASLHNHDVPCGAGSCSNFTAAMAPTATFTTAVPLAPKLVHADVLFPGGNVLAFTVFDGLTSYTLGDPQVVVYQVVVSTDAAGQLTELSMIVSRWQNPGPHSGANMRLDSVNTEAGAYHNVLCQAVDIEDRCTGWEAPGSIDGNTSSASVGAAPAGGAVQAVPVDNPFALLLTAAGLLALARRARRSLLIKP